MGLAAPLHERRACRSHQNTNASRILILRFYVGATRHRRMLTHCMLRPLAHGYLYREKPFYYGHYSTHHFPAFTTSPPAALAHTISLRGRNDMIYSVLLLASILHHTHAQCRISANLMLIRLPMPRTAVTCLRLQCLSFSMIYIAIARASLISY